MQLESWVCFHGTEARDSSPSDPFARSLSINESSAQTTTSDPLTGVASDPSQAVMPDARVEIKGHHRGHGAKCEDLLTPSGYTLS